MIYVCIPSHNEARTVGLLLWKVRQTFTDFPRDYQLLVVDDASTDATQEVLEPYARVLPLTVIHHAQRQGYAASVAELLRLALERTDRPRRDAAILMHADFAHDAASLPDLVRQIESGADLVVAEADLSGTPGRAHRLVRRAAPLLLGRRVRVPGVRDLVSGFAAFRLVTLRDAFRERPTGALLRSEGWAANAELLALAARHARRIERIRTVERMDRRERASRSSPWATALSLWRSRRDIELPSRASTASSDPPVKSLPAI